MESRREFLKKSSLGLGALAFPNIFIPNTEKKLRVALVGLGRYSGYMADGIMESKSCTVAGLVTGTPSKKEIWGKKYGVPSKNIYDYQNFDEIARNPDIDAIYIILPNALHKEYAIRAANAKKHVIVEKPMGISAKECLEIITACEKNKVQLAVGYRLHFEPYNMEMMRLGQNKIFGKVNLVEASLGYKVNPDPNDWHYKKALSGGGPLQNLGVYCVQAARYITGEEPESVTAQFGPVTNPNFKEVEESITWQLHFASGTVATSSTTYNSGIDRLFASADNGNFELSPAISYGPFRGRSPAGEFNFPEINQQQTQMDELAKYILNEIPLPLHITGHEGLKDMRVIDAIYKAAASGRRERIVS